VKFKALAAGTSIGNYGSTIMLHVEDADYPDCRYQEDLILSLNVHVLPQNCESVTHFEGPSGKYVSYASVVFGAGIPPNHSLLVCYLRKMASSSFHDHHSGFPHRFDIIDRRGGGDRRQVLRHKEQV
jgi:hypothetical protein